MSPFEIVEPASLREAAVLSAAGAAGVRPVAGGTAIMLMMKTGLYRPGRLVSLRGVEERYARIEAGPDGAVRIGALATLAALEHSPAVRRAAPAIARALRTLANVRVRNVATLGGHLAHADPHMDLPPLLIALNATVSTVSAGGGRTFPLEGLHAGYLETTLEAGELIAEVHVPARGAWRAAYFKYTARSADDWPALGIAAALDVEGARGAVLVRDARLVAGAVGDVPARLAAAEGVLRGARIDDALHARAGAAAAAEAAVIADSHGSSAYKRELLRVCLARAVRQALQEGGDGR